MVMRVELITGLSEIPEPAWDALVQSDDPFAEYRFLRALEDSGSVGPGTGWQPIHVTVWEGSDLVGALPLYLKGHSYGEYIFDWSWASAAHRLGIDYYPKLVSMVPLTPATGQRLLLRSDQDLSTMAPRLLAGAFAAAEQTGVSSLHILFLSQAERDALVPDTRLLPRLSMQYHWTNQGYASYDDYLGRFRAPLRKQARKERRRAAGSGLDIRVVEGPDLTPGDWAALRAFYFDTCYKRGSGPYLTEDFFDRFRGESAGRVLAVLASDDDRVVAGALNFRRGKRLYGRYWGCVQEHDSLHFECCYHRLIEYAIDNRLEHFEAGAQGIHKLRRGLLPARVHSVHWVRNPVLADAVAEFLPREAMSVEQEIAELAEHGPFRREQ
ncbi:MAG: GNAT family N-acetyltransferase [Myxococcales bacterium]|nr:GNAT family N-acetyltransferase [Myxococcales bacterium]